ncbi:MAG TPA: hypothetical protein VFA94_05945 [Acidimicrobiales bacterium]|nr:hypothetical protein [Acidimicrobiales bacterium]
MRDNDVVPGTEGGGETALTGEDGDEHHLLEELADRVRGIPAGLEDPNIVGDVGPTDIPPGTDPHEPGELSLDEDEVGELDIEDGGPAATIP